MHLTSHFLTEQDVHQRLGAAMSIMAACPRHARIQVGAAMVWLRTAIEVNKLTFHRGDNGRYLAWWMIADVSQETLEHVKSDVDYIIHPSEWIEGHDHWIVGFACLPDHTSDALKALRNEVRRLSGVVIYRTPARNGRPPTVRQWNR